MVADKSILAATSRLFSSAIFRQLARKGKSPIFARLVREIGREQFAATTSVADVFDTAFKSIVVPGRRDEYVYKSAIAKKVLLGRHTLGTASMLTEVRVDRNKADVVVLNRTSTVYEIKSERDCLTRLRRQLDSYRHAFASVNVITSPVHLERVMEMAPTDVGLMVLTKRGQIREVRSSLDCPERIIPETLFTTLRIQEATQILAKLHVPVPKVPNTERYGVVHELFVCQSPVKLHSATVEVLRNSRSQLVLREFLSKLPSSLQAAALSTPIRRGDQSRLISAVETPFVEAENWA